MISQERGNNGWEITVTCDYCLDPVYTTGPTGRGTRTAALLHRNDEIRLFCSPACRSRWLDLRPIHPSTLHVADDVRPDTLTTLLPSGLNGTLTWPDHDDDS